MSNQESTQITSVCTLKAGTKDVYTCSSQEAYLLVRCFQPIDRGDQSDVLANIEKNLVHSHSIVIFEFCGMNELCTSWNWVLIQLSSKLKKNKKQIGLINVSSSLESYLKKQGIDSALMYGANLTQLFKKLGINLAEGKKGNGVNVELFNPFLEAMINVIESQTNSTPISGSIYLRESSADLLGDVSGYIELNGAEVKGAVVLSFPKNTVKCLAERIFGDEPPVSESMITDSVGEMTNIMFTRGKKVLNEKGFGIDSALPKITISKQLPEKFLGYKGTNITIPFKSEFGEFYAEVRLAA